MRSTASGIFRKMIALSSFPSASGCSTPCSAPARFWMWIGIKGPMWSSSTAWKRPGGSPSGPSWRNAEKMQIGAAELPSRFCVGAPEHRSRALILCLCGARFGDGSRPLKLIGRRRIIQHRKDMHGVKKFCKP